VIELLTNEELHAKMSSAARETAVTRFATSRVIPQYESLYKQLCCYQ
jgi:glycosyltransferase involved in cell wall biosynthesis